MAASPVQHKTADELRRGASACLKAIQSAKTIELRGFDNPETNDNSITRYFRDRDEIKAVFAEGMGNLSPYQLGFLSTLAEYIHTTMAVCEPDAFDWNPEAIMTETEVKEERYQALLVAGEVEEVAS
jgi:hypothetical protein